MQVMQHCPKAHTHRRVVDALRLIIKISTYKSRVNINLLGTGSKIGQNFT